MEKKVVSIIGTVVGAAIIGGVGYIISKANEGTQAAKKQAKKKGDPKFFHQKCQKVREQMINGLQKLQFQKAIKKHDQFKDVMFIGDTSCGKTSLINSLFGTKLPVGLGVTTNQTSAVFLDQKNKIRVWDTVGQNTDFQFYTIEKLTALHSMDTICILYRNTPKRVQNLIKLICGYKNAKYKVIFVRTCSDQWKPSHTRTLDEELVEDSRILRQLNVSKPIIFKTSAYKPNNHQNNQLKLQL